VSQPEPHRRRSSLHEPALFHSAVCHAPGPGFSLHPLASSTIHDMCYFSNKSIAKSMNTVKQSGCVSLKSNNQHLFPLVYLKIVEYLLSLFPIERVSYPISKDKGLVSGLHRNSAYRLRRAALASSLDTSGVTDKHPVPIQSCRIRSVRMVMFLAPTRSAWSV